MKILVIGGTRMIGRRMIQSFLSSEEPHDITIVSRGQQSDSLGDSVKRVILDLMSPEQVKELLPREHFDIVYDTMVLCPNHIKERLSILNCDRYVMVSTDGVYRDRHIGITEDEYDVEQELWKYCGYLDAGYDDRKRWSEAALVNDYTQLPSIRIRIPVVFGIDDYTNRLRYYVEHIIKKEPLYIDNFNEFLPFISSKNAGDFLYSLHTLKPDVYKKHLVFNAACNGGISIREICEYISRRCGNELRIHSIPFLSMNKNSDCAPYNGSKTYSLNTSLAQRVTKTQFDDVKQSMYNTIDELIQALYIEMGRC